MPKEGLQQKADAARVLWQAESGAKVDEINHGSKPWAPMRGKKRLANRSPIFQ